MTTNIEKIDINKIVEIVTPFDDGEDESLKEQYEPLLKEIQGNILKSHGRNHAVYLFLTFNGDNDAVKEWIGSFSHRYVDSALEQAKQGKLYRNKENLPGKLFANFFLTRAGYMHLGYQYHELPNEDPFRQGMQDPNMQNELGDDINQWDPEFKNEIHALVLLAGDKTVGARTEEAKIQEQKDLTKLHDLPALLKTTVEKIKEELSNNIATVVRQETGYVLRDKNNEEIEHFGFRDGVSQPLFLKRDIDKARKENGDFDKWDPRAPLSLVLFKDPLGKEQESYGSFLVFRKLEQNVGGWNRDVVKLARELGMLTKEAEEGVTKQTDSNGAVREPMPGQSLQDWMEKMKLSTTERQKVKLAEAYTMGRFRDGTPVVIADRDGEVNNLKHPVTDNFNYQDDSEGSKCPFFAHTRKVNPRGDTGLPNIVATPIALEEEKMHRIVRRGIAYGKPTSTPDGKPIEAPEGGVGLLFMCFQASLISQFNFMQQAWAKQRHFVKRDVGTDVVIGVEKRDIDPDIENDKGRAPGEQYNWPKEYGKPETKEVTFKHWITMRGGEFFFAPSISFLKSLAPAPIRNVEINACENKIAELEEYKNLNWAIGLNGDTGEEDGFAQFFKERKLTFEYYVQANVGGTFISRGDSSAYDKNIATLKEYIETLKKPKN